MLYPDFRFNAELPILEGWQSVFKNREQKKFSKKTVILQQGDRAKYLYFIVGGLVEYTYSGEDGTQELLEILGDGNLFCLYPIFGNNPTVGSFVSLEDSVLSLMSIEEMNRYIDEDSRLAKELLSELSRITGGLIRQLHNQTKLVDKRVEDVIYSLADYKRKRNPCRQDIMISLSQDDLARISRTTRVTVTKALAELRKQKFLETVYGGIIVRDLNGLKNYLLRKG